MLYFNYDNNTTHNLFTVSVSTTTRRPNTTHRQAYRMVATGYWMLVIGDMIMGITQAILKLRAEYAKQDNITPDEINSGRESEVTQ